MSGAGEGGDGDGEGRRATVAGLEPLELAGQPRPPGPWWVWQWV